MCRTADRARSHSLILPLLLLLLLPGTALAEEIRLELPYGVHQLKDAGRPGQALLELEGTENLRDFGQPKLPVHRLELVIPRDARVASVRLEGGRWRSLGTPTGLARDAGQVVPGLPALRERHFDPRQIESSSSYPPVEVRAGSDQFQYGYHLAGLEIFPLRVDRASGELWLIEGATLVVELSAREDTRQVVDRRRRMPGWREAVRSELAARVVNPADLDRWAPPEEETALVTEVASVAKTPSLSSSPVQLLILTNDVMRPPFQRLADHRTALGMPALVVTIDEILANYRQGLDLAETLRLYIADAYAKWGVDYVLLGGDSDVIPARYAHSTFFPPNGSTDIPADLYYAALEGNWNDDGDAIFGEPFLNGLDLGDFVDFTPEVSVGRATVSDLAAATNFVDKILAYELPVNVGYQSRALFMSEVLFPDDWVPGEGIQLDGAVYSEEIVDSMLTCDPFASWSDVRFYENYTPYPGSLPELKADVVDSLNSGHFGVVNHIGHGSYFLMSVGDGNLGVAQVDVLQNAPNYFLLYALNCSSGAFDFNCLLERFIENEDGGSVASIGSSRAAFPNTANLYQQDFYRAMLCDRLPRLGDVVDASRIDQTVNTFYNTSDRWTHFVYNLLGDPSLRLWSTRPRTAGIGLPGSAVLGENQLTITVTDVAAAAPFEGVTVALSKDGEDYAVGVTDAFGEVTLDFAPETLGDITVWVSGAGALPQSTTLPITDPAAPHLSVASLAFDDTGGGNGNGRLEAGEQLAVTPLVHNGGSVAFGGGDALLRTDDPWLSLVDSTAVLPSIPAGADVLAGDSFLVDVDPDMPDGHEAELRVICSDGGATSWADREIVLFSAAELEAVLLEFDDSVYGDGDGILDVNEEVEIVVTLKNYGAGAVQSVSGVLSTPSANVVIHDGAGSWPGLPDALSLADNDADRFRVSETDLAFVKQYDLTLTDDAGRVQVVSFDLDRPSSITGLAIGVGGPGEIALVWAPGSDSDLRGYRVYRRPDGGVEFATASADVIEGSALFRDAGLPALSRFEYYVVAVDSGGLESDPSGVIQASTAPPEAGCFPLPLGLETSGDLAVSHMENDGVPDMVVGADLVYVIDGNCQEKLDGDNDSQTFGPISDVAGKYGPASIAMANLNGLPGMEVVASSWGTRELYVFDRLGNVLPGWPRLLKAQTWTTPVVGDLDADGDLEIVVNDIIGYTYAFHHDGTEVADGDGDGTTYGVIAPRRTGESYGRTTPALYDVDGDDDLEILFGSKYFEASTDEYFYALRSDGSGLNAPGWPKTFAPLSPFLASPTVADLDGDLVDEIVVICENDSLYVWHPDGSRVAPFPVWVGSDSVNRDSLTPSVAVGDFTHDGTLEMVVCSTQFDSTTKVYLFEHDGSQRPGWPIQVPNFSEASPVVGDINGDGGLDIVFGLGGANGVPSYVYAWNDDGSLVEGFPIYLAGYARASAFLTDFDNDGNINVMLASWDKLIHVWDMGAPYDPALVPWPTFRGNVYRDGVFTTVPATAAPPGEHPSLARAFLRPNVPNPFNPSTLLRFELPAGDPQPVRLRIYDARGRLITTLFDGLLPGGPQELRWEGRDDRGARVPSGVYFAQLAVEGQPVLTRKMALVK